MPKCRLPARLPSRPESSGGAATRSQDLDSQGDDDYEEGTWDRSYVKTQSMKNLKAEQKKLAKEKKEQSKAIDALAKTM